MSQRDRERDRKRKRVLYRREAALRLWGPHCDFMTGRGEDKGHSDESGSSLLYRDDVMRERDDGLY